MHGGDRCEVGTFVEERRPDLGGGLVTEPFRVECLDDLGRLRGLQGSVGPGSGFGRSVQGSAAAPVVRCAGGTEHAAGSASFDAGGDELVDRCVDDGVHALSSGFALFEIFSKSACTFPWTPMMTSACASLERRRSFSVRSLASSDSDGPPRPPSDRPRAAFSKSWRCWHFQSLTRLE